MNDLNLTREQIKSIITNSLTANLTKEQLQSALQAVALCFLHSTIDFPSHGPALDTALDNDFGFQNRNLSAQLRPSQLLHTLGLIP